MKPEIADCIEALIDYALLTSRSETAVHYSALKVEAWLSTYQPEHDPNNL